MAGTRTRHSIGRRAGWTGAVGGSGGATPLRTGGEAYSVGVFDQTAETASLVLTDLAPQAGGDLEVRVSGSNMKASLEVWGLPKTEPDEYYELWLDKEGGHVSVGTFTVDDGGRGELSTLCPEVDRGYQRAGITLERFPEEPRMNSARAVLRGDLPESWGGYLRPDDRSILAWRMQEART